MGKPLYFGTVPYFADENGELVPEMPAFGPCGKSEDQCCLELKDKRSRSTGPGFPLHVLYCQRHDVHFTLYPLGHVPYGRACLAELSPDGKSVVRGRDPPFEGTYFDAALDASRGIAWPNASLEGHGQLRFLTQCRHLHRCCKLLGINVSEKTRERVAELLRVPVSILYEQHMMIAVKKSFQVMGEGICRILALLTEDMPTFQRLATSGSLSGIWGAVQRWDGRFWRRSGLDTQG